jgi:hypothetical protein
MNGLESQIDRLHSSHIQTAWIAKENIITRFKTNSADIKNIFQAFTVANAFNEGNERVIIDITLILDKAIKGMGDSVEPSISFKLLQKLCQAVLIMTSNHGCILKVIRNILKHCIQFIQPFNEISHVLFFLNELFTSNLVQNINQFESYCQVQLLKTIRVLVDIIIDNNDILNCCGKSLLNILDIHILKVWKCWTINDITNGERVSMTSEMVGFFTGNNKRRRFREAVCTFLRVIVLLNQLRQVEDAAAAVDDDHTDDGGVAQNEYRSLHKLLRTITGSSQNALEAVRLMSESDDDLLVLLNSSISVAMSMNISFSKEGETWQEWNPTCLIGHLSLFMGQSPAVECIFDTLMSPENGVQMLTCLLRVCKLNRSSKDQYQCTSYQKGIELLTALKVILIKCQASLPFGIGPLLRIM